MYGTAVQLGTTVQYGNMPHRDVHPSVMHGTTVKLGTAVRVFFGAPLQFFLYIT